MKYNAVATGMATAATHQRHFHMVSLKIIMQQMDDATNAARLMVRIIMARSKEAAAIAMFSVFILIACLPDIGTIMSSCLIRLMESAITSPRVRYAEYGPGFRNEPVAGYRW